MNQDIIFFFQWYIVFLCIGIIFLPLANLLFKNFPDKGYIFSKILGIAGTSYLVFLLSIFKILPFTLGTIVLVTCTWAIANTIIARKTFFIQDIKKYIHFFIFEEVLFVIGLVAWTYVKAHEPSIHGLEKFMDFGFVNSNLRSLYLPAPDMWLAPFQINYYYFGHFITALLTKVSFVPAAVSYNLMLATLFAFTLSASFSLGIIFLHDKISFTKKGLAAGLLSGFLVALSGNLQTIYAFFTPYKQDHAVPFWNLLFSPQTFPNTYWYPNATRFISFTIHEFPSYSFVVSDLHGHVTDIPFVLVGIAIIYSLFTTTTLFKTRLIILSLFLSIMYMTNAWDAIIYLLLSIFVIISLSFQNIKFKKIKKTGSFFAQNKVKQIFENTQFIKRVTHQTTILVGGFFVFGLPFSIHFKPFVSGIGVICAPNFLIKLGHLGPFLFEANHCQRTPFWQFIVLYGFFYFFVWVFILFLLRTGKKNIKQQDIFILLLIILSTILLVVPEFIYVKDIYPAHYRANTMFKLAYQAFIMLSLSCGYIITRILSKTKSVIFLLISMILLMLVFLYPYFSVKSYFSDLKKSYGLDGTSYLKTLHPQDYKAIIWINKNIAGQPVILEAQGDSYTDYARISSNTGLPTILGWTVHEWLWRGTYDIPSPRIEIVKTLYETPDSQKTSILLKKYKVIYVYVGDLEREKYPLLQEEKFGLIGSIVFSEGNTRIYKIN